MTIQTIYAFLGLFAGGNFLQIMFRIDHKKELEKSIFIREKLEIFHALISVLFWLFSILSSVYYYYYPFPYYLNFKGTPMSHLAYHSIIVSFTIYLGAWFNYHIYKFFYN